MLPQICCHNLFKKVLWLNSISFFDSKVMEEGQVGFFKTILKHLKSAQQDKQTLESGKKLFLKTACKRKTCSLICTCAHNLNETCYFYRCALSTRINWVIMTLYVILLQTTLKLKKNHRQKLWMLGLPIFHHREQTSNTIWIFKKYFTLQNVFAANWSLSTFKWMWFFDMCVDGVLDHHTHQSKNRQLLNTEISSHCILCKHNYATLVSKVQLGWAKVATFEIEYWNFILFSFSNARQLCFIICQKASQF